MTTHADDKNLYPGGLSVHLDEKSGYDHREHDQGNEGFARIDAAIAMGIAQNTLVQEASEANEREKSMNLWHAFRVYPKAMAWSIIITMSIVMDGYDASVMGSFNAYPSFQQHFGIPAADGTKQIPPSWQNGISGANSVGVIFGLQFAGFISERYGYRWTIISALLATTGLIFIPFFADSLAVFLVGELFLGMAWGVFQTMTTAYAAEVCPVPLRHFLTSFVNFAWVIGSFISSGVLVAFESRTDIWGYRIPFALQWIWPIPIAIATFLAPESPWWCVRHGHKDRALRGIKRLARKGGLTEREADAALALMIYTDEMEKAVSAGSSYWDCFKGIDGRRTEISCMLWMAQALSGPVVAGNSTYLFEAAGISASTSFKLGWIQSGIGGIGTIASWFALTKFGRKPLILGGCVTMLAIEIIVGCLAIPQPESITNAYASGGLIIFLVAVADFTTGPVIYAVIPELPSTRLRAKTIVLARNAYNIVGLIASILTIRQLNPLGWNWGAKMTFFWAAFNIGFTVYLYFRLPETKGRTFAEIDILFENKIPSLAALRSPVLWKVPRWPSRYASNCNEFMRFPDLEASFLVRSRSKPIANGDARQFWLFETAPFGSKCESDSGRSAIVSGSLMSLASWVSLIGSPCVVPNTVVPVLFEGNTAIDIPPGATWVSDPIEFSTETGDDITISLYIAEGQQGVTVSGHEKAKATSWVARGDLTSNGCLPPESQPYPFERWYYLTGIEAEYEEDAGNIACFGDSITDQGDVEWDMNQYLGWPDVLSRRIQQTPNHSRLSVLNVGISGDQVWRGGLRRLERDVLTRNGVKFLFLFMGTNDLSSTPDTPDDQDELYHRLIGAYDQLVTRAHARGIAILASTITPFLTVQNQSAGRDRHREVTRLRLNKWIKDAGKFDYVVDWSSLLQDAEDPHIMAAKYRFNDFTHPNQAANRLMAEALDLHALSTRRGAVIESPSDQRVE
ncbi:hypothetical protein JCM24511_09354 [Saitozyma sp. JCM 24511]|nr:hypothetical protein JCM24511_09354 [Saitozyma sp. JCM 24511]